MSDDSFSQIFCNYLNVDEIFSWHNQVYSLSQDVQQKCCKRLTNKKVLVKNVFEWQLSVQNSCEVNIFLEKF